MVSVLIKGDFSLILLSRSGPFDKIAEGQGPSQRGRGAGLRPSALFLFARFLHSSFLHAFSATWAEMGFVHDKSVGGTEIPGWLSSVLETGLHDSGWKSSLIHSFSKHTTFYLCSALCWCEMVQK